MDSTSYEQDFQLSRIPVTVFEADCENSNVVCYPDISGRILVLLVDISASTSDTAHVSEGETRIAHIQAATAATMVAMLPAGTVVQVVLFDRSTYNVCPPTVLPFEVCLEPSEIQKHVKFLFQIRDKKFKNLPIKEKTIYLQEHLKVDLRSYAGGEDSLEVIAEKFLQYRYNDKRIALICQILTVCRGDGPTAGGTTGWTALASLEEFIHLCPEGCVVLLGDGCFNQETEMQKKVHETNRNKNVGKH